VQGTVVVTDHVFGDLDVGPAALGEIGHQLEQAPRTVARALTGRPPRCPVNPEVLQEVG
jgi:hypothetical protein